MMSLDEQARRMRHRYPDFDLIANWGFVAQWEGWVRPLAQAYKLRITYVLWNSIAGVKLLSLRPAIWVLEPRLQLFSDFAPGQLVPHIYPDFGRLDQSRLCVFDPVTDEWTMDKAIADTIVPWSIDWLACYEGWLATGEWTGGGREH
jgi:hypothetical protein